MTFILNLHYLVKIIHYIWLISPTSQFDIQQHNSLADFYAAAFMKLELSKPKTNL